MTPRKPRTCEQIQAEYNATQMELGIMAADESLEPELRAAILFGAASALASPRIHTLDLSDLDLRVR